MSANLTPGKKAKGGVSVRLSAYLTPEVHARFLEWRAKFTAYELAQILGDMIEAEIEITDDAEQAFGPFADLPPQVAQPALSLRCPHCGAEDFDWGPSDFTVLCEGCHATVDIEVGQKAYVDHHATAH